MRRKAIDWTLVIVLCSYLRPVWPTEMTISKEIETGDVSSQILSFVTPASSLRSDLRTSSEFSSLDLVATSTLTVTDSIGTEFQIDSSHFVTVTGQFNEQTTEKTIESSLYEVSHDFQTKTPSYEEFVSLISTSKELESSSVLSFQSLRDDPVSSTTIHLTKTIERIIPTEATIVSESTISHNIDKNVSSALASVPSETSSVFLTSSKLIIPTSIAALILLVMLVLATAYRLQQRGRRRKVYLSHREAPPKDFADDTAVQGPVLLPEEIEMQTNRATSFRVQRAIVLETDAVEPEDDETRRVVAETDCRPSESTTSPSPPPYRTPPPYITDTIIENVHAL